VTAKLTADVVSIHARQHQIQNDEVRTILPHDPVAAEMRESSDTTKYREALRDLGKSED
jgi:hypothetical protein